METDPMHDMSAAEARKNFAELLNRVAYGKERVVLTRHGKQICALVPVEDLTVLDTLREMAGRQDATAAMGERVRGESVAWTDLKRELGLTE
jgi:prevent-host-death family protein